MRLLLTACLVAAMVAGCAEPAPAPADVATATEEGAEPARTARGGVAQPEGEEQEMVRREVFSAPVQLVGGVQAATFEVDLAPGARDVAFLLSGSTVLSAGQLRVELADCGLHEDGTIGGSVGGSVGGTLCREATPGKRTLTVSNPGGVIDATLRLDASFPAPARATEPTPEPDAPLAA